MEQFLSDFAERCAEVEEYLCFIKFFDNIATNKRQSLLAVDHYGTDIAYTPSSRGQQILRSNFYLIIYNLTEATTNSIITSVIDQINDEKVPLVKLKDQIKKLYIGNKLCNVQANERRINYTIELLQHIETGKHINIKGFNFNISGNVDYNFINQILNKIGCIKRVDIEDENLLKNAFEKSKIHRNKLAHGDELFSLMGASLLLRDMEDDYQAIKTFFTQVLNNLKKYLENRQYLKI